MRGFVRSLRAHPVLTVGTMMIMPNGTLDVGTEAQPISPNVTAGAALAEIPQAADVPAPAPEAVAAQA